MRPLDPLFNYCLFRLKLHLGSLHYTVFPEELQKRYFLSNWFCFSVVYLLLLMTHLWRELEKHFTSLLRNVYFSTIPLIPYDREKYLGVWYSVEYLFFRFFCICISAVSYRQIIEECHYKTQGTNFRERTHLKYGNILQNEMPLLFKKLL